MRAAGARAAGRWGARRPACPPEAAEDPVRRLLADCALLVAALLCTVWLGGARALRAGRGGGGAAAGGALVPRLSAGDAAGAAARRGGGGRRGSGVRGAARAGGRGPGDRAAAAGGAGAGRGVPAGGDP